MKWTTDQEAFFRAFQRWRDDGFSRQLFTLYGDAGTGKTEVIKHICNNEDRSLNILIIAFTQRVPEAHQQPHPAIEAL